MPRTVTLVLCSADGTIHGALAPFDVATPWWQEAVDVVEAARVGHGIDVTIVRLLDAERDEPPGGRVTYLAELAGPVPSGLAPVSPRLLVEHPSRQTWARPGGSSADLRWADAVLTAHGTPRSGRRSQVRAWNLSSLWRIPTTAGPVWLKVVPPFFAHEGAVLRRIAIGPPVLATDGPRSLLAEVSGEDLYEPSPAQVAAMVRLLVAEQARWIDRVDEVLALGALDWRSDAFVAMATDVVERTTDELDHATAAAARQLVDVLPATFEALAACGIPDSLVHGDFHGGNVRADGARLVLLDWGDAGVGHPLLDQPAALERLDEVAAAGRAAWTAAWQDAVPGSDPARAARLVEPVAALRQAVIYRQFLDAIEPSEQPFHRRDPARWIGRAVLGRVSARSPRGT